MLIVFIIATRQYCFAGSPQTLYNCDGSLYCTGALIQARNKAEVVFQRRQLNVGCRYSPQTPQI